MIFINRYLFVDGLVEWKTFKDSKIVKLKRRLNPLQHSGTLNVPPDSNEFFIYLKYLTDDVIAFFVFYSTEVFVCIKKYVFLINS